MKGVKMGITKTKLRTRNEIENKILELFALEKETGNSRLVENRMSPRRQGKIRALKWCLGQIETI